MTAVVLVVAGIAILYCIVRIHQLEEENSRLHKELRSLQHTVKQKDAELGDLHVRVKILESGAVKKEISE